MADQDRRGNYGTGRDPREYGGGTLTGRSRFRQEERYGSGGYTGSSGGTGSGGAGGSGDEGAAGYYDPGSRTGTGGGYIGSYFNPGGGYEGDDDRRTARGHEGSGRIGSAEYPGNPNVWEGGQGEYDYDYGGSHGQLNQEELGGDMYGGGGYGLGPYERSEKFGGDDFPEGGGPYSDLQRQYEQRYVSGGYPRSWGNPTPYGGRADYSPRQQGRFWQGDYNPETRGRGDRTEEGPYYGAMGYRDRDERGGYGDSPYRDRESARPHGPGPQPGFAGLPEGGYGGTIYGMDEGRVQFRHEPQRAGRPQRRTIKGYQRTDERIKEDICERLAGTGRFGASDLVNEGDIDVSDVTVDVKDGVVTLEGTVPERHMKHRIEDIAEACPCVKDVENRIRVRRADESGMGAQARSHTGSGEIGEHQGTAQQGSGPNQGSERSRRL